MNIEVFFGDFKPAQVVQQDAADIMRQSFERFGKHIRSVNLVVTDVNGPKGEVDKQCRCVVHLKRMAPIVIQDRDNSYVSLLKRVADRAAQTLNQRVDRNQVSYRSRKQAPIAEDSQASRGPGNALLGSGS